MNTRDRRKSQSRRAFLKNSAAAVGLAVVGGALANCAPSPAPQPTQAPTAAPTAAPAAAPTATTAPAPTAVPKGKAKISYAWDFGGTIPKNEELVKKFNEQSKTIEVEFQLVPYDQVMPKLQTAFAGGAGPDCLSITGSWMTTLAAAGYLEDLESRAKATGLYNQLTPLAFESGKVYKGLLYYVSFMVDVYTLYYNKKLFEEAGLKEAPKTTDEFQEYAKKLTVPANGQFGAFMPGAAPACDRFYYTWATAFGGIGQKAPNKSLFDAQGKCIMGSPKHVEGLQRWLDMYIKDKSSPEASATGKSADQDNAFKSGKVGMAYTWLGGISSYGKALGLDNLGTAVSPTGPSGSVAFCGTNGFSMNAASKNKDATWEFLMWMLQAEQNAALCKEWGSIPCNVKALEDPYLNAPVFVAPKKMAQLETQFYPPRHVTAYGKFFEQAGPELSQKAMLGQITAKEWGEAIAKYYDDAVKAEGAS